MSSHSGSRSDVPSAEALTRVNPRGDSSATLDGPSWFVSRSSSSIYSTLSGDERLVISPPPPRNQQIHLDSQTKLFLRPTYEYEQTSQSPAGKSIVVASEAEDDLTLPLNLIRNTGQFCQDRGPQMNTRLYSRSTEMAISASHLDRQINSFIQETNVRSPEVAPSPRQRHHSSHCYERGSPCSSSPNQPRDSDVQDSGDEDEDDARSNATHSNLRMGGSRPPSRAVSVHRRSRAPSACSSLVADGEESQIPGYLFLHEVPPLRIRKSTVASHPPLHSPKQKGKGRGNSRPTSHQQHHDAQLDIQSRPPADHDAQASLDMFKSPQHVWYFIRRLVGLELRWEAARAWKLTDLNLNSVPPRKDSSYHHPHERSDDDASAYSWDSSSGETTIAPESLPILRYLVQNFLLTLPIIRDTVSVVQNVPHSSHFHPQDPTSHTSVAVYWSAGILPILRRLHQSNLSATIDLGSPGFLNILFDSHIARLLERFIATSLKICTHRLSSPRFRQTMNATTDPGGPVLEGTFRSPRSMDRIRPFKVSSPRKTVNPASSPESDVAPDPMQAMGYLAPDKFSSNRTSNSEINYFRDITPIPVSHAHFDEPEREQPRAFVPSFHKEPQRYSGVSVQPSQRGSIGVVTPSNSNCVPDLNQAHPLNRVENYSVGFLTHDAQKASAPASIAPSSKTFSSVSTHDRQPTDTEVSTFMPSVFGSIQDLPLKPSWSVRLNRSDALIERTDPVDSLSVAPAVAPSEEVKSVRQTIERMKLERQYHGERRHQDDNKSNSSSRLSRKFSWVGRNGPKVGPDTNSDVSQKVSPNFDLRTTSMLSEEARVPHTPMLNKSFHAKVVQEALHETHDCEEITNNHPEVKIAITHDTHRAPNLPLKPMPQRVENLETREEISGTDPSRPAIDQNPLSELLPQSEMREADTDTASKRASKWGFALKSLSLHKSNDNQVRAEENSKTGFRKSWRIRTENAPTTFLPPSLDSLSLKFSQSASQQVADTASQKAAIPESLARGLSAPYENIYEPASLQFQFQFFEMPKDTIPWPWGDPVPFWKGTPVHKLSWGGFEVDLVGVRQGITKNSYVIRVRRPSRLDEYVLRKESQFKNYGRRLSKDFPNAHIRAVPTPEVSLDDDVFAADSLLPEDENQLALATKSDGRAASKLSDTRIAQALDEHGPSSSTNPCFMDPFSASAIEPVPVAPHEGIKRRPTLASIFGVGNHRSKFSVDTRSDWNGSNRMMKNEPNAKNERLNFDREIVGSAQRPQHHPSHSRRASLRQIKFTSDIHRRALRGWLRDTLSIRTVGHHPETAAFLLLGSVVPEEKDLLDIRQREKIDEERRTKRVLVAQGAAERSKTIHDWWSDVKSEFVNGDGVQNLSKALKEYKTVEELPVRFQKGLEWIRMNIAEGLHELLVIGNQSDILFGKLLGLNAAFPWSMIKNALKIKRPNLMGKALLEIFLAKRLNVGKSKHSVIQRLIEIAINETEGSSMEVERRINACRARIQSLTMCEKIIKFVHASNDIKNLFRQYAESADMELVVVIVRSAEEPRLDKYDLERIMSASKAYKSLLAKNDNRITSSMTENIHVRLILDLKLYLRLISQEWDSKQIRKMLSENSVAEAVEVLINPLLEFLKRTYHIGNAARALDHTQDFIEQLITVVNALRSRIQDPQKSIRVLGRLISRHQNNFYGWLHEIHAHDSIIEEFFQWLSTAMKFLKEGLLQPIMVSEIIPPGDLDQLSDELDEIVEWEEKKRKRQYEQLCRRYSADVDGDDPVIVEGDGFGRSKVEPLLELKPLPPQLDHIACCLDLFRRALGKTLLP